VPPTRAFYSVVQYVPDAGRAEAANAGVALYVPATGWLEARMSPTLDRVRHFFRLSKKDLRRVERAVAALKYRLGLARSEFTSGADFAQFVAARADAVRLTQPRLAVVQDPIRDLNALYDKLVGEHEGVAVEHALLPTLPPHFADVIVRLEASHKVWRPSPIRVPTVRRRLPVSFAYENGKVNYVRPESLAAGNRLTPRLESLSFNGRLIH
jgi:Protein of unknown function (DUF3037)